jgi:hypothetical protein
MHRVVKIFFASAVSALARPTNSNVEAAIAATAADARHARA